VRREPFPPTVDLLLANGLLGEWLEGEIGLGDVL
jgi:hypothetical protein